MGSEWLDSGLLGQVRRVLRPWTCHLVGGAVRDHLLGRPAHDLDLVTSGGDEAAAALCAALAARLVPIGGDRFAATRVVGDGLVIDIWDRGPMSMEAELARRDLTINAMAIDLGDGSWLDPHGGRKDIESRRLRATTDESFAADPLRILRLARLAAELPDFAIDAHTEELAAAALPELPRVAAERRREEFGRSLRAEQPERALAVWAAVGFYPRFLGVVDDAAAPRALAAFERAAILRRQIADSAAALGLEPTVDPDPFTLFAALLLDSARADVESLLASGYASRREARDLALTVAHPSLPAGEDAQRWFLHRAAHVWPTALCFAAAATATDPAKTGRHLEQCLRLAHTHGASIFAPTPLLRGDEIQQLLGLPSGPEIGLATRRLRRRQVEGHLADRDQAVAWLLSARRSSDVD
jgi:tRNA nucleotidyltransferase/poly(A) polymerase